MSGSRRSACRPKKRRSTKPSGTRPAGSSSKQRRLAHVERLLGRYAEPIYAITRIVVGMMYWLHGTTKWFDWPPGARTRGAVELASLLGVSAVIETVCGTLIIVG